MILPAFAACQILLGFAASGGECPGAQAPDAATPGACLLQQGGAQLQRATRAEDVGTASQNVEVHSHAGLAQARDDPHGDEDKDDKDDKDSQDDKEMKHGSDGDKDKNDDKEKKHREGSPDELMKDGALSSLRLELRLKAELSDLRGEKGPLPEFLAKLKSEFVKAVNISEHRLDVLDVRGVDEDGASLLSAETAVHANGSHRENIASAAVKRGGDTIVDMEVLAGTHLHDPSAMAVYLRMKDQLRKSGSELMSGQLKDTLQGASLTVMDGVQGLFPGAANRRSGRWTIPVFFAALSAPLALC